jgi:hypothetical protein
MTEVPWQAFTTFGRLGGTLTNGLNWKVLWQSVTVMNGTIHIDDHTGEVATTVRLGNNSTAFVDNSRAARWPRSYGPRSAGRSRSSM